LQNSKVEGKPEVLNKHLQPPTVETQKKEFFTAGENSDDIEKETKIKSSTTTNSLAEETREKHNVRKYIFIAASVVLVVFILWKVISLSAHKSGNDTV
jgi:hypothetical protein